VPLKEIMEEEFNMPTILENDANAGALAEWKFGRGQGYRNLIFLTMGTGMGAGLILNGKLYSGTNGLAGEVGHIRLRDKGPLGYHKRGSFEGFCSGSGMQKLSKKYFGKYIPTDVLIKKALKRDKKALQVIKESGKYLGRGLSILIDILNPEIIIIGTLAIKLGDLILAPARQIVKKEALLPSCKVCKIVAAGLGDRLGDIAALTVAMQ
jgi:glucokinase